MKTRSTGLPAQVERIVAGYLRDHEFERARDALHDLPPNAMREVLARATAPGARGRDLLVTALSDVVYPPALPAMRGWLDDADTEAIVLPALSAIDRAVGGRFAADRVWDAYYLWEEIRAAIVAWWDAGEGLPSTDEEPWLREQIAARARDEAAVPPPSPALRSDERQALRADLIALKQAVDALDPRTAWALDLAAIRRVLPIYERHVGDVQVLRGAIEATERAIAGGPSESHRDAVTEAVRRANAAAGWSKAHDRYRDPGAKAAAHVAQGVLYVLSPEKRNRPQAMHNARDAIEYAGGGFAAVRAELDWQLGQARDGR